MKKAITIIYAPSGKRIIPVPPNGISMIGGILSELVSVQINIYDLECEAWIYNTVSNTMDFDFINHIEVLNFLSTANPDKNNSFFEKINKQAKILYDLLKNPDQSDIFCISVMGYYQIFSALLLSWYIKNENKNAKIILGGIFFNKNNVDLLEKYHHLIDFIHIGTAHDSLLRLIKELLFNTGEKKDSFENFAYYDNDCLHINAVLQTEKYPRCFLYEKKNLNKYKKQASVIYNDDRINDNIMHIYIGDKFCPYRCNYCRTRLMKGKIIEATQIARQMEYYSNAFDIHLFNILANEINPSKNYLFDCLNGIKAINKKVKWLAYFKPILYEKAQFELLYECGCRVIRYGVETGSQRVLDRMEKQLNVNEISEVLKLSHKNKIWNHINLMIGYPHENCEDIEQTISFLKNNKDYIDSIRLNPFYLPPDCGLALNPDKYNIRLVKNKNGYFEFDEIKGLKYEEKINFINTSIKMVLDVILDLKIGFQGVLPFMLLTAYSYFEDKELTKQWYKKVHPYTFEPLSSEEMKANVTGKTKDNKQQHKQNELGWNDLIGKRGNNYNLKVNCND